MAGVRLDPRARRKALLFVSLAAVAGSALILGLQESSGRLQDWIGAEPDEDSARAKLIVLVLSIVLSASLGVFAAYAWTVGVKVERARLFPPQGTRVVRETPVLTGEAAVLRGRLLKALAICLGVGAVLTWLVLWKIQGGPVTTLLRAAVCGVSPQLRCILWPSLATASRSSAPPTEP